MSEPGRDSVHRDEVQAPPPWRLTGIGWIIVCRAAPGWVAGAGRLVGGPAALMIVHYRSSPVGPYEELLYVPGRFAVRVGDRVERHWSVTHIFVSTRESVLGGRLNWGLPKEQAQFDVSGARDGGSETTLCTVGGNPLFEATLRTLGPRLPAFTWPWRFTLAQERDGHRFVTRIRGSGWIRYGRVVHMWGDGMRFPDLADECPLFAVRIEAFRIVFPAARIVP
jgi:hypothetical protein